MFRFKRIPPLYLFALLVGLLLAASQTACSTTQREELTHIRQGVSDQLDRSLEEPNELVFAGQVEDQDGRWLNDCVVVLFKNGKEVTRTTTRLMESAFSDEGPMDGVFELRVPNVYKLSLAHEVVYSNQALVPMSTVHGMVGTRYLGAWFDDLQPAEMHVLQVPDKQLEYALVVLPMSQAELPPSHLPGNLSFQNGMLVIGQGGATGGGDDGGTETAVAAVPASIPPSNAQFTVLPKEPGSQAWNLKMTGYYGNRWDVWERFLAGRIPGLTWETFKQSVLVHNPHLEEDSFVFYPEKSYLLPFGQ